MERIPMKRIREVIRLHTSLAMSRRAIGNALGIGRTVVGNYLDAFEKSGITADEAATFTDDRLIELLVGTKAMPEKLIDLVNRCGHIAKELTRRGVTLRRLWREYRTEKTDGYAYSQFCHHFRLWSEQIDVPMHIEYTAGDKMLVDFAGEKMYWNDPITGEPHPAELFVAVLGASQWTYVEACESQQALDFVQANMGAFDYFGGVTNAIVPDCLKSAVIDANRYEPVINRDYATFAEHYCTVVLPARARKPRDKAVVEGAVRIVYQRIHAALRDRVFHSLSELNEAIRIELVKHNEEPMQRLKISRRQMFLDIEKTALKPLPVIRYEPARTRSVTAAFNYHVYLHEDKHYYSYPYRYRGEKLDLVYTSKTVRILRKNSEIAVHERKREGNPYSTVPEHMPPKHRWMKDAWTPEGITAHANRLNVFLGVYVSKMLESVAHPEQAYKMSMGLFRLAKEYPDRIEKACKRGMRIGAYTFRTIEQILETGADGLEDEPELPLQTLPAHENIRGAEFYATEAVNE